MALVLADRVRDTTTTTGTGTVTLSGTAPTGYQNFSVIGNGNTTYYTINGGSEWEVGIGTYSSTGPTLARTTVLSSSNSDSLVNFSAGTKDVFVTYPAEKSIADGYGLLPVANGGTGVTSLTSGYLIKGNGTSAVSASAIYQSGTDILIGTTTPDQKLTVNGAVSATSGYVVTSPLSLFGYVNGNAAVYMYNSTGSGGTTNTVTIATGNTERMRVDSSGLVGIGTASPSTYNGLLNVKASDRAGIGYFGGTTYATRLGANSSYATIEAVDAATGVSSYQPLQIGGSLLKFDTGGSERMRIDSSGNVGIGTTSPQSKMEIRATSGGSVFNALTLSNYVGASAGTGVALYFDPNGAGTLARAASIQSVQATSGNYADLRFYTANSDTPAERVRVTPAGNVGIGTTNPTSLLDVNGNAEVNGTLFLGSSNHGNLASDTNTLYPRGDNIAFQNAAGSGTYAYINSSGDFGIGTTSLSNRFTVKGGTTWLQNFAGSASSPTETVDWPVPALNVTSYGDFTLQTMMTFTLPNDGNYFTGDSVWNFRLDQTASSTTSSGVNGMRFMGPGYLMFGPGTTEKARITSSGNWLVGTTSLAAGNWANEIKNTTTDAWPLALNATTRGMVVRNSSASSGYYAYFEYNGGTNNGSISWSGGTTAYNTTSDARIKENIVDAPEAGSLIDSIKVRSWDFKADGNHWRYGMVAQELLDVAPEAVSVPEDPEMMMGVDYAKLVPMLIKEVQSLRARVAQLEGN